MHIPRVLFRRHCGIPGRQGALVPHCAFTLVELLLVVAIIGILASVSILAVSRSMHGGGVRSAARTVIMCGRYARSMAVLRQVEMVVVIDLDNENIAVMPAGASSRVSDVKPISRNLDKVDVSQVEMGGIVFSDGTCSVPYMSNGRCRPYKVRLVSERGGEMEISVDELSSYESVYNRS